MRILVECMICLKEMHSRNFIHRDLKLEKILIGTDGKYKLSLGACIILVFTVGYLFHFAGDFNTSKILEGTVGAPSLAGTLFTFVLFFFWAE